MIDIDSLIKQAMKSKNKAELEAYKNIKVEIQKNQTAKGAKPLTDVNQLIKEALLAKDKIALNAYKNLKTELQKVLTAKNAPEYSEALLIQVTAKYAKSLEDAIKQFSEAHRDDLVSEYTSEWEIVKKLLPAPVNELDICFELDKYCRQNSMITFSECPFEAESLSIPKKQMGTVIKYLKSKFPIADGKMISDIVKRYVI